MLQSLLPKLPALSSRLSALHAPRNPCLMRGIRLLSMRGIGEEYKVIYNDGKISTDRQASEKNETKNVDNKVVLASFVQREAENLQHGGFSSNLSIETNPSLSILELERLLKEISSSTSESDPQLRERVLESLNMLSTSPMSLENLPSLFNLLELLVEDDFKADPVVKRFVSKALRDFNQQAHRVADQTIAEFLKACAQTVGPLNRLPPEEQSIIKELIGRVKDVSITKDFSLYCQYFYALGEFQYPWKDLPREKRKHLLSCLKQFEAEDNGEVEIGRRRLIYGFQHILTLKQSAEDMDEGVRDCYERLLMRELEGRNGQRIRKDEKMPIVDAIFFQLRSLAKLRGEDSLSKRQLDLTFKGFEEEWQMRGMNSSRQALVLLGLGEMGVSYRSLSKDLWSMMMEDLRKKMQDKIQHVALSSLLKGWKNMGYKCKDMEQGLKEAVLRAVIDLCRDKRDVRGIANAILYLGGMEADWKDMKVGEREILEGIGNASMSFSAQELSNTLQGLAYMKASWKGMTVKVRQRLLVALEDKCKDLNEQAVTNTFYSLGHLGLTWKEIPISLKEKLLDRLNSSLFSGKMIIIGMNGCMNGLTTMGYDWKSDEKVYEMVLKNIEGWYGDKAKIKEINTKSLPTLCYSLGEGKVQWEEVREDTKQALMNGIEVYCKGEDVNAKKVSNMIYGLRNMGATIHNMPAVMKETLEEAVRKIVKKSDYPQHIANIMFSFSKMQYSWEMIGKETLEALLEMIRQSSKKFDAQGLSNTCYSVAVMIRGNKGEREKSYFLPLQECLLRRYYEIQKVNEGKGRSLPEVVMSQLAVYLSWLETLPSSSLSSLLQSLQQDKLPDIEDPQVSKSSRTHKRFSERLRVVWREMMEKEVREGKISEERKEELIKMKIVDKYYGLSRKVFPVDVAIVQDVVGLGGVSEEKVRLFIEIHSADQKYRVKDGNAKIFNTTDQLKGYLYGMKYRRVSMRRYDVREIFQECESVVDEVVKGLWKKINKK